MREKGLIEKRVNWEKRLELILCRNLEKKGGRIGQEAKGDLEEESEGSASDFCKESREGGKLFQ